VCVCVCVCLNVCVCVCARISMCVCVRARISVCLCTVVFACMYAYMCAFWELCVLVVCMCVFSQTAFCNLHLLDNVSFFDLSRVYPLFVLYPRNISRLYIVVESKEFKGFLRCLS
jgi:hypothetical protein